MQRVGVAGIGNISKVYLDNITGVFGKELKLTAVADTVFKRAEKAAAEYKVKAFSSAKAMAKSASVDIVLNLTPPKHHFDIGLAALSAGKHIYNEKPLCIKREEALQLIKTAAEKGLRVGGAPDTFLGAGIQTCIKLIDDGWIGQPVAATAFFMCQGPEDWHPDPDFIYKAGGGPLFNLGPYYLTALVSLLGPVARVCGSAKFVRKTRTITSKPHYGEIIKVEVPTHITGVLDFASGVTGTIITSYDIYSHTLPCIEIYGSEGTLRVPDPNTFGGPIYYQRFFSGQWSEIPLLKDYAENSRGLGLADMALAIEQKRPHRASGELTLHVLDIMHGIHDASASGKYCKIKHKCKRPSVLMP
ncbi:MAG: Gfo/Idh/MocA family oxidoreductase [Treponema sp.]|nr:Gfo/Idh/MocA family oxidoreductase [Treponema sp.]